MSLLYSQLPLSTPKPPYSSANSQPPTRINPVRLPPPCLTSILRNQAKWCAVAGIGSAAPSTELDENDQKVFLGETESADVADYDWMEQWYPLYLTKEVPDDAPLGLTVFDKQLVLYRDGAGELRCHEDRCPHRLAKLSEGQLIDGRLECLYHGWQFEGNGSCVKIPQLPGEAKIPKSACLKPYEVRDSQGVVWVWMSQKATPNPDKLPWFENLARPGFQDTSSIHEVPYDHSIALENLMDPAHVPISHDRSDFFSKREDAQALRFEVTDRSERGFAGWWGKAVEDPLPNFLRFESPCVFRNDRETVDEKTGERHHFSALFLCRPSGQGKCMVITRFGGTKRPFFIKLFPKWFFHQNACKVFEQDMGFLSSQNEVMMKERVPTKEVYLNLKSSDTWVVEYRKWMDKVGHGMPYHWGHRTVSPPKDLAVVEHAPAGLPANLSASSPAKGGLGTVYAPNLMNRYLRHVVHCRGCREVVKAFRDWKNMLSAVAALLAALAILAAGRQWKVALMTAAAACCGGAYICNAAVDMNTVNFIRPHRRL